MTDKTDKLLIVLWSVLLVLSTSRYVIKGKPGDLLTAIGSGFLLVSHLLP